APPQQALDPPLLVTVNQDFAVRYRGENVAGRFQLRVQLAIVIDFTVEDELDAAVLITHRLPARFGEVDDGEPQMAQHSRSAGQQTLPIRTAMPLIVQHTLHERNVALGGRTRTVKYSGYATHKE